MNEHLKIDPYERELFKKELLAHIESMFSLREEQEDFEELLECPESNCAGVTS